MPVTFRRKLRALDYQSWSTFDVYSIKQVQDLVLWVENQKVRLYKIEDRGPLQQQQDVTVWSDALNQYLHQLGCPYHEAAAPLVLNEELSVCVVEWLLNHAVSLEYYESASEHNECAATFLATEDEGGATTRLKANTNLDSEEFQQAFTEFADTLSLPPFADHRTVLNAAYKLIRSLLVAKNCGESAASLSTPKTNTSNTSISTSTTTTTAPLSTKRTPSPTLLHSFDLDEIPLGFDTGDAAANRVAKVLRLLYLEDLRDLQNQINNIMVEVQNETARPKTDVSLGRVGRGF